MSKAPTLAERWASDDNDAPLFMVNGKPNVVGYRKQDKTAVEYGRSKDSEHACLRCEHFDEPNACARVLGLVSPKGWCKLWKARD